MIKSNFHTAFILLISFIIGVSETQAQQHRPSLDFDQFRKDIAAADSPEDKLNEYVKMSLKAVRSRPDSLFEYAKEIRNISGIGEAKREAFSQFILANGWRVFNRDSALYHGNIASEELKKLDEYEDINPFSEGLAIVRIGNYEHSKYGFIDKNGKVVVSPKYGRAWSF